MTEVQLPRYQIFSQNFQQRPCPLTILDRALGICFISTAEEILFKEKIFMQFCASDIQWIASAYALDVGVREKRLTRAIRRRAYSVDKMTLIH